MLAPVKRRGLSCGVLEQFIDTRALGQTPIGPQRGQHGHGNHDAARPRRHFVNIEIAPIRKEHQLRRNGWNQFPSHGADQREVKPHIGIGVLQAAETMDRLARFNHMPRFGGAARQLQGKISFAGSVELGRPTGIDGPAAIGELPAAHIICELGNALGIGLSQNVQVIDVIGFQGGVRLELALPVSFLCLNGKKVMRTALDGLFQTLRPILLL